MYQYGIIEEEDDLGSSTTHGPGYQECVKRNQTIAVRDQAIFNDPLRFLMN